MLACRHHHGEKESCARRRGDKLHWRYADLLRVKREYIHCGSVLPATFTASDTGESLYWSYLDPACPPSIANVTMYRRIALIIHMHNGLAPAKDVVAVDSKGQGRQGEHGEQARWTLYLFTSFFYSHFFNIRSEIRPYLRLAAGGCQTVMLQRRGSGRNVLRPLKERLQRRAPTPSTSLRLSQTLHRRYYHLRVAVACKKAYIFSVGLLMHPRRMRMRMSISSDCGRQQMRSPPAILPHRA